VGQGLDEAAIAFAPQRTEAALNFTSQKPRRSASLAEPFFTA